jgi:hypothetical protein
MNEVKFQRRFNEFNAVIAAVKADAWKDMPCDEAVAFWRDVIEKSDALLEVMDGRAPEIEQRLMVLVTDMKQRGKGIVAGLVER